MLVAASTVLGVVGAAGARPDPPPAFIPCLAEDGSKIVEVTEEQRAELCVEGLAFNLSASPNPPTRSDVVTFEFWISPGPTDCWDSFGNTFGWTSHGTFQRGIADQSDPFVWELTCVGSGYESARILIDIVDEPPPAQPAPQCSDGIDNTDAEDTLADHPSDPGCSSPTDDDETDPRPPPQEYVLVPGDGEVTLDEDIVVLRSSSGVQVRCKRQEGHRFWFQAIPFLPDPRVIRYDYSFRVCYVPHNRIMSVSYVRGDATMARPPWDWQGNSPGYPNYERNHTNVVFNWRGKAAVCLADPLCIPATKDLWIRIVFRVDNTIEVETGVV